jgi:ribosome recycling factor
MRAPWSTSDPFVFTDIKTMSIQDIKKNAEQKMQQSIDAFKNSLTKVRTGRANPGLLDTVQVDYYGSMLPISQVANVSLLGKRHGCEDRKSHP